MTDLWPLSCAQEERLNTSPDYTAPNDLVRYGCEILGNLDIGRMMSACRYLRDGAPILSGAYVTEGNSRGFRPGCGSLKADDYGAEIPSELIGEVAHIPPIVSGP